MSKKESISDEISDVKKEIESYVQNKIDLTKLHIAEDLSKFTAAIAVRLVLFYIAFFVLFFLSIAISYAIGRYLDSLELGFFIVAGFYFVIGLLFFLFKGKFVQKPIIQAFIHLFFPNYTDYDKK
ncbi:phage holin family protein [Labilibacter marinus]|uniref:phage holin family protein n=1 Tax=Labilibacter marinus TaxID=1477105 RepID=UPI00082BE572|nr:phage holin family protein [Labilibacter marinus]